MMHNTMLGLNENTFKSIRHKCLGGEPGLHHTYNPAVTLKFANIKDSESELREGRNTVVLMTMGLQSTDRN